MKKFELFPKEWTATHGGHKIRVRNSWSHGIRLYLDDECCTSTTKFFALSRSKPLLWHRVTAGGASFLIEVFCFAIFSVKAKIVVDGEQIAGDRF